jgi:hypothetical protein
VLAVVQPAAPRYLVLTQHQARSHGAAGARFQRSLDSPGGHGNRQARATSKSRFGAGFPGEGVDVVGVAGPDDDQRGWTSRHAWSDPGFTRPTRINRRWDRRAVRRNRGTHRGCWS